MAAAISTENFGRRRTFCFRPIYNLFNGRPLSFDLRLPPGRDLDRSGFGLDRGIPPPMKTLIHKEGWTPLHTFWLMLCACFGPLALRCLYGLWFAVFGSSDERQYFQFWVLRRFAVSEATRWTTYAIGILVVATVYAGVSAVKGVSWFSAFLLVTATSIVSTVMISWIAFRQPDTSLGTYFGNVFGAIIWTFGAAFFNAQNSKIKDRVHASS